MPLALNHMNRFTNVKWGGDVIVVFMETSAFDPQPVFTLTPITDEEGNDKSTFLKSWNTKTWSGDEAPLKNSAYKVASNAGKFLTSKSPKHSRSCKWHLVKCAGVCDAGQHR